MEPAHGAMAYGTTNKHYCSQLYRRCMEVVRVSGCV